ncbi:hypothetical protein ACWC98_36065, partial [Streptomyces goshikiensis]
DALEVLDTALVPVLRELVLDRYGDYVVSETTRAGALRTEIRTTSGPDLAKESRLLPFCLVSIVPRLYHQETKNLLVSYSPKKLGFF